MTAGSDISTADNNRDQEPVSVTTLYEKLAKLEWLLKRKRIMDARSDKPRMDPTQGRGRILATLAMKDGISTKDLSYILGIAVPTLNETLAKLDRAGLITREPSEKDRRIILNYLTDAGREAAPELGEKDEVDFLECLDDEKKAKLTLYLDRINGELEDELGMRSEDFAEHQRRRAELLERLAEEGFPPPRDFDGPRAERCHGPHGPHHPKPEGCCHHDHHRPHGPHRHPGPHGYHPGPLGCYRPWDACGPHRHHHHHHHRCSGRGYGRCPEGGWRY